MKRRSAEGSFPAEDSPASVPQRELTSKVALSTAGRPRIRNLRWGIGFLLAAGIYVNYADRTNISLAATPIINHFHISHAELGIVLSSFLWTYALVQVPFGLIIDRVGVKWIQRIATIVWAGASFLTAIATGMGLILVSRLILGVAEGPGFPATMKATGYWFPRDERALGTALFSSAGRLSNVIASPVVALLITAFGWRGGFWGTGIISVVFAVIWWIFYRDPKEMRRLGRLSAAEYEYILDGQAQREGEAMTQPFAELGHVLRQRKVWGLSLGLACAGYVSWVLLTWLPGFLQEQTHLSVAQSGFYSIVPWIVAGATEIFVAGYLIDRLVKRGGDETRIRKFVLISGMIVALGIAGAGFTHSAGIATIFLTLGTTGIAVAFTVSNSLPSLIAAKGTVATVGGFMNFVNTAFGIAAPIVTGFLVDATGSFVTAFVVCGVFLLAGIFFYVVVLGKIEPISSRAPAR